MSIIEIKVTLEHVEPSVTRTLQVPASIRLERLHLTLQAALGWTNSHLYKFKAGEVTWSQLDPEFRGDDLPVNKTTLAQVLNDTDTDTISYIYDFGDYWEHELRVGKATVPDPEELYPRLTDVFGRCPPEDVGGSSGYEHFLEAISDPSHPEHEEMAEWADGTFDSHTPDADELRLNVFKLARKWQPRKA